MNFSRLKELRTYEGFTQQNIADILHVQRAIMLDGKPAKILCH